MEQEGPATAAVLLPVKPFANAKGRLATHLSPGDRTALARRMADRTIAAARGLPVAVVCADDGVAGWARHWGAAVVPDPGGGLNRAVSAGVAALERQGFARIVVAHADLPLAEDLRPVARFGGVSLVPDRRDDGTNVLCVPAGAGFRFAYGAGSFHRHAAEARRLGLGCRVLRDLALGWDVDEVRDLPVESS